MHGINTALQGLYIFTSAIIANISGRYSTIQHKIQFTSNQYNYSNTMAAGAHIRQLWLRVSENRTPRFSCKQLIIILINRLFILNILPTIAFNKYYITASTTFNNLTTIVSEQIIIIFITSEIVVHFQIQSYDAQPPYCSLLLRYLNRSGEASRAWAGASRRALVGCLADADDVTFSIGRELFIISTY